MANGHTAMRSRAQPSGQRVVVQALSWSCETIRRGIVDYAHARGWRLLDLQCYSLRLPRSIRPDGVIFDLDEEAMPLARQLLRLGVPAVQIQDHVPNARCPRVVNDRRAIGRAAAEHFAERGFRQVACQRSANWQTQPNWLIGESFVQHARRLGVRTHIFELQRFGHFLPWTRVKVFTGRLLKELSRIDLPVGILTYNDMMAARICHFCIEAGLSVPEQVAVIGLGNNPLLCDCAPVPLSSVDPNYFTHGRTAAEVLDRQMNGEPPPAGPILVPPVGVVTRRSSDVLAVPDVSTARALRYVWEHLDKPLSPGDVAKAIGVSRRTLYRAFRTHLGRSFNEELNRKRIERSCELLTGTKQSVASISPQVGFSNESYLFRVFRKQMGMTPRQYRLAHTAKAPEAELPQGPGPG